MLASEGADWSRHRRIYAPSFSKKVVSDYVLDIWLESHNIIKEINNKQGQVIDMIDLATSYTVHVIGLLAFGLKNDRKSDEISDLKGHNSDQSSSYFFSNQFKGDMKDMLKFVSQRVLSGLPDFLWKLTASYEYEVKAVKAVKRVTEVSVYIYICVYRMSFYHTCNISTHASYALTT